MPLIFPIPPLGNQLHHINQRKQHRHLYQWADCGCQRLIRIRAVGGSSDRNGQLEIVAGGGETLGSAQLVPEAQTMRDPESEEEDYCEIHDKWCCHTHHRYDLMNDLMSLTREQDEDCIQKLEWGQLVYVTKHSRIVLTPMSDHGAIHLRKTFSYHFALMARKAKRVMTAAPRGMPRKTPTDVATVL